MRGEAMEICAGALALDYGQKGGDVRWHGKPHPEVYRSCLALLDGIPPARIAAIGDSLRTDVAGAHASGIGSIFIAGGIHTEELHVSKDGRVDPEAYERSEEPTSELQSLMRISYAAFCSKTTTKNNTYDPYNS